MKTICVFGSSSEKIDRVYLDNAEQLGSALAQKGYDVVFGAGKYGVMGAVARGVKREGGKLIGVSPDFFTELNVLDDGCTELILTPTMRKRKALMEEKADAFVVCPGGIGTFEEFFEVITLKQLQRHDKPIIILNDCGYYDPMLAMMRASVDERFMVRDIDRLYTVAASIDEVFEQLENYIPFTYSKY